MELLSLFSLKRIVHELCDLIPFYEWSEDGILTAAYGVFGSHRKQEQINFARWLLLNSNTGYCPSHPVLQKLCADCPYLVAICEDYETGDVLNLDQVHFSGRLDPLSLSLPQLAKPRDICAWLDLPLFQLDWFTDEFRQHGHTRRRKLQHYHYHWRRKRSGGFRLIEEPKPVLKKAQRLILRDILDKLPAHEAVFGFVPGKNLQSCAALHAAEDYVIRLDISHFFTSCSVQKVHGVFRSLGYPYSIARILTGLCTTETPGAVFRRKSGLRGFFGIQKRGLPHPDLYRRPHLAQGSPTSPALSNFVFWQTDQRISALCKKMDVNYSRYADDMIFSGSIRDIPSTAGFIRVVENILAENGFHLNQSKTRIMQQHQRQTALGMVVNRHLNVPRREYDTLRAILTNCVRHGIKDQNREGMPDFRAHMDGKVTWVENVNPAKGARLRVIFDKIDWAPSRSL